MFNPLSILSDVTSIYGAAYAGAAIAAFGVSHLLYFILHGGSRF